MERVKLSQEGEFRRTIRLAIAAGVASTGLISLGALAQEQAPAQEEAPAPQPAPPAQTQEAAVELEKIEITGSRIKRVELETASPVYTVDRATIQASGVTTVGELIQELPSIRGNATNPQVNNGGGTGEAFVSLRGLGEDRTLILLNGRRLVTQDVNALPLNLIERVEVLNEGASAIYGSDAIGGVVNFITRKDFSGTEVSYDSGITSEGDGKRKSANLSWGATTDRANILLGLNYNDQEAISAADRDFSKYALYLYSGVIFQGGSSRAPRGRIFLPSASFENDEYDCIALGDPVPAEISVTRIPGAAGSSTADYRCFVFANDSYNYQAVGNVVLTPQERVGLFTVGNYKIKDFAETYFELFDNNTKSGFAIAPLPFDARLDDVVLSQNSAFNPFGIDLGGASGSNPNFLTRLEALGNRRSEVETQTSQLNLGLRGPILDTSWRWDVTGLFGRINQHTLTSGYLYQPAVGDALGPSFDADPGVGTDYRCGTPGPDPADPLTGATLVGGCTPVNFFNLSDPAQIAALNTISANYTVEEFETVKGGALNFAGDLLPMPAGNVSLALGTEYREERLRSNVDFLARGLPPDYLNCYLAQETCTNATNGSFDVTEYYAETLIPILSNQPAAKAVNVIIGTRFSDYSNFGSTTNSKIGAEWRPVDDLLVRGSFAQVFRAPTIEDLFSPRTANAPTFNDPCVGLTAADVAANPNLALACENVPQDGTFQQPNSQITGLLQGNPNLDPETGDVYTLGAVYEPEWLPGISGGVTFWNYKLDDTIESLDVNTIANQCIATGDPKFCGLIQRFPDGSVQVIGQPTENLGKVDAQGFDVGLKYQFAIPDLGRFRASLDTAYIDKFDRTPDKNNPQTVVHNAGTFSRQDGNFSRVRGIGGVDWDLAGFEAQYIARYIGKFKLVDPDGAPGVQPDLDFGATTYHAMTVGYTYSPWQSKLQVGVNNMFDKDPPILFQNNVINANTDVETFDTVGRFYWVRLTQNF